MPTPVSVTETYSRFPSLLTPAEMEMVPVRVNLAAREGGAGFGGGSWAATMAVVQWEPACSYLPELPTRL